jgi:hypothetical protein
LTVNIKYVRMVTVVGETLQHNTPRVSDWRVGSLSPLVRGVSFLETWSLTRKECGRGDSR